MTTARRSCARSGRCASRAIPFADATFEAHTDGFVKVAGKSFHDPNTGALLPPNTAYPRADSDADGR